MKNQDNNFKRALLKELTGFSYKDKASDNVAGTDEEDSESFDFIPADAPVAEPDPVPSYAAAADPQSSYSYTPAPAKPSTEAMATTTISKATIINGGVQTRENITVEGIVNGDIISKGKVMVKGKVEGNITGYDVDISTEELTGDITCESKAVVHAGTKLIGNMYVGRATVVGTVEGNIIAKECIELLDNAIVYGDIKATSISVSEGAVIYGMVTIGKNKPEAQTF